MKGKIDENSNFVITRKDGDLTQICPYRNGMIFCGTACPKFREPKITENPDGTFRSAVIKICDGEVWEFTEFVDER